MHDLFRERLDAMNARHAMPHSFSHPFYERAHAMNARVEAALPDGVERYVHYSSYETEVIKGIGTVPVDNLDKVAVADDFDIAKSPKESVTLVAYNDGPIDNRGRWSFRLCNNATSAGRRVVGIREVAAS